MDETDTREAPDGATARRSCGACTLCCYIVAVQEFAKPKDVLCQHCAIGLGCKIYPFRPASCRDWACAWLKYDRIPDLLYPNTSHVVINDGNDAQIAFVSVDPNFPDAWLREPVHSFLKSAAVRAYDDCRLMIVQVERRHIVLLPDRDLDLGLLNDGEEIVFRWVAAGPDEPAHLAQYRRRIGSGDPLPEAAWQDAMSRVPARRPIRRGDSDLSNLDVIFRPL